MAQVDDCQSEGSTQFSRWSWRVGTWQFCVREWQFSSWTNFTVWRITVTRIRSGRWPRLAQLVRSATRFPPNGRSGRPAFENPGRSADPTWQCPGSTLATLPLAGEALYNNSRGQDFPKEALSLNRCEGNISNNLKIPSLPRRIANCWSISVEEQQKRSRAD